MKPRAFFLRGYASLLARLILGATFIYLGIAKAADPVAFLKMARAFELVHPPLALNLVAAILPWFEIVCGLLLLAGVFTRGTALVFLALLIAFTVAIAWRAVLLHRAGDVAFCAIRFDCGCGTGDVLVCAKLVENLLLLTLCLVALRAPPHPFPRRVAIAPPAP